MSLLIHLFQVSQRCVGCSRKYVNDGEDRQKMENHKNQKRFSAVIVVALSAPRVEWWNEEEMW